MWISFQSMNWRNTFDACFVKVEASKRLRQEHAELRAKYDNLYKETDEANQTLRRRFENQINELTAHLDGLSKSKIK